MALRTHQLAFQRRGLPLLGQVPVESEARWRWSQDAKLVPTEEGGYAIANFAFGSVLRIAPEDGRLLRQVSGLTAPFALPTGLSPETRLFLDETHTLIPHESWSEEQATTTERITRSLSRSHGFIVMPTGKCNFRCTYCYESFEEGRMTPAHADSLSRAIRARAGSVDQFSLAFFGGEPLLCPDLVLRFSREALEVAARRGLPYAASISTNGALLDRVLFEELFDAGVAAYQISIDGDRELHDRQRVSAKGQPTFDAIASNLRDMQSTDFAFRCTVRANVAPGDLPRVLDAVRSEMAFLRGDPRFVWDVHVIWSSDREEIQSSGCGAQATTELDRYWLGQALHDEGLETTSQMLSSVALSSGCYAGKPNWFVVGPDLSLYKCTVVFDRPENRVGYIDDDGELVVDEAKDRLWTGSNVTTDAGCSACHLRVPCGGIACPLSRFTRGEKACLPLKQSDDLKRWATQLPSLVSASNPG